MRLLLHDGTADGLNGQLACYASASETDAAPQACTIARDGDTITSSVAQLYAYKSLTVAVGFTNGAFAEPQHASQAWQWVIVPWLFFLPLLALLAWVVYLRVGPYRDARGRGGFRDPGRVRRVRHPGTRTCGVRLGQRCGRGHRRPWGSRGCRHGIRRQVGGDRDDRKRDGNGHGERRDDDCCRFDHGASHHAGLRRLNCWHGRFQL